VIGRYPEYLKLAEKLGSRRFSVPKETWERMTPDERWAANQRFLDRAIARQDEFVLATPVTPAIPLRSSYRRELEYLLSKGYRFSSDQTRLLPAGL
jgi:hypothetical protein